jgi:membrane-bound inhibitor of C-type lysozyme
MSDATRILSRNTISLACLAMIAACSSKVDVPEPLDQAMTDYDEFDCAEEGLVRTRFVGPDTVELLLNDESMILTRERSASGAKYVKGDVVFWNKGDEALLLVGESRHSCKRET